MARPRSTPIVLLVLVALTFPLLAACGSPPEQAALRQYFQASRMRDNTTLANIATVSFNPTEQGIVQNFNLETVGPEERRTLRLRELAKAFEEARQADEEFNKRKKEYQDANLEAIERVLAAENANQAIPRRDQAVKDAWDKWRAETADYAKKLTDARQALSAERALVEPSVLQPQSPAIDVTQFDGELLTKDVQFTATVRKEGEAAEERQMHARFTKAELTNGPEGQSVSGRWMITQIGER